jgi:hypothetical protein
MTLTDSEQGQAASEDPITEARMAVDRDYLRLGRELYVEFASGRYRENGTGATSFDQFAASKGVDPGRARRLRRVFKLFSKDLGISFQRLETLGYERAIAIMPVITNSNKDFWMQKAATMDYVALVQEVKEKKPVKKRRQVVKEVAGSQKQIYSPEDSAKLIAGITDDRLKPSADGKTDIEGDDVVYQKTIYLIGDQNNVFEAALENIERRTGSTKAGYQLTCALMEFLAHEATRSMSDDDRMRYYMGVLERRYGGKLVWMEDKKIAAEAAAMLQAAKEKLASEKDARAEARAEAVQVESTADVSAEE